MNVGFDTLNHKTEKNTFNLKKLQWKIFDVNYSHRDQLVLIFIIDKWMLIYQYLMYYIDIKNKIYLWIINNSQIHRKLIKMTPSRVLSIEIMDY